MNHYYLSKTVLVIIIFFFTSAMYASFELRNMVEDPKKAPYILHFKNLKKDQNLSADFINFLKDVFGAAVFVETGTLVGGTTYNASLSMDEVLTIELSEVLYHQAVKRFEAAPNVMAYHGDSSHVLPKILKDNGKRHTFWLDGHYSEGITAKGDLNTPILAELSAIKNAHLYDSIILIDDIRIFQKSSGDLSGTTLEGYPEIQAVLEEILKINPAYKCALLGDILMCYIPQDNFSISPVVQACTLSRILSKDINFESDSKLIKQSIKNAQGEEKAFLNFLFDHFGNEYISQRYSLNRYFNLWHEFLTK